MCAGVGGRGQGGRVERVRGCLQLREDGGVLALSSLRGEDALECRVQSK